MIKHADLTSSFAEHTWCSVRTVFDFPCQLKYSWSCRDTSKVNSSAFFRLHTSYHISAIFSSVFGFSWSYSHSKSKTCL